MSAKEGKEGKTGAPTAPAAPAAPPHEAVVDVHEDFYNFEDDLTDTVEAWAAALAPADRDSFVDARGDADGTQHPLAHTALHRQYQDLFERILTEHLEARGFTVQQFYRACAAQEEALQRKRKKGGSSFAAVVFAASDFDFFCEMMADVAKGNGVVYCPPLVSGDDDDDSSSSDTGDGGGAGAENVYAHEINSLVGASRK